MVFSALTPVAAARIHQTVILALAAVFLAFPALAAEPLATSPLFIAGKRFDVEVATTPEAMERGLMFRTELAENAGMLFLFDAPMRPVMWMKNTLIPLDMVFIAPDGRVVHVHENAVPKSEALIAPPMGGISAVLELPGGTWKKFKFSDHEKVVHAAFSDQPSI